MFVQVISLADIQGVGSAAVSRTCQRQSNMRQWKAQRLTKCCPKAAYRVVSDASVAISPDVRLFFLPVTGRNPSVDAASWGCHAQRSFGVLHTSPAKLKIWNKLPASPRGTRGSEFETGHGVHDADVAGNLSHCGDYCGSRR